MSASQRRQLERIESSVGELLPELTPRVIEPSAEKQKALGIAESTILLRVGNHRMISVNATEKGEWSIKEFDASSGDLVPIWDETGPVDDSLVAIMVLGAAVGSLQEQLEAEGDKAVHADLRGDLETLLATLRERQATAAV